MKPRAWLIVLALATFPVAARADTPAADDDEGDDREPAIEERVTVKAGFGESDVAAFATTIDGEEITRRGEDLADVLRRVPGARVQDYGGIGSYATISLRASTSEQVTVLVDGVPQNRALGGPVDLSSIPATQLDRVTVYRGFAPASLGQSGLGGVVDIRTRSPEEPGFDIAALAGGLGSRRLAGSTSIPTDDRGGLRVGIEALRSDGDFLYLDTGGTLFDPGDDELVRRQNNEVEQGALLLRHVREVADGDELDVGLRLQRRSRGVPGVDSQQSLNAALDESLDDLTVAWNRGERAVSWNVSLNAFRQIIDFADPDGDIGVGAQDQTTRIGGVGAAGVMRTERGRQAWVLRGDLGAESADVTDTRFPSPDRGGSDRIFAAIAAEDRLELGRWSVAPSLQWKVVRDTFSHGEDATAIPLAEDSSDTAWTGKVGAAYRLSATARLRGSVGRFQRWPSLLELFGDRGAVRGNPSLRPERGISAELGVSASGTPRVGLAAYVEAVAFGRRSEDLIRLVQTSQAVATPRNIADADVYGLELAATLRWRMGLMLDGSVTLQHSEETSGFAAGNPLPYQPERLGYAGAAFERRGAGLRWEVTYVGQNSVDRLDTPEVRLDARVVHDAELRYAWENHGVVLGLDVRNVFDRQVRDVSRYPLPGRTVFVHLGWAGGAGT